MSRTARGVQAGYTYHVLNRSNGRARMFHKPADYDAFIKLLSQAKDHADVQIFAYCLMSNHWHLVVSPAADDDLAKFMRWLCTAHVRRHHAHYHVEGGGHLYQG